MLFPLGRLALRAPCGCNVEGNGALWPRAAPTVPFLMVSERDGNIEELSEMSDEHSALAAGAAERSASGERPLDEFGGGEESLGDDGAMVGFAREMAIPIRYLRIYLAVGGWNYNDYNKWEQKRILTLPKQKLRNVFSNSVVRYPRK